MHLNELIKLLTELRDSRGNLPCLIAGANSRHNVKQIDYSRSSGGSGEHVYIQMEDSVSWEMKS